MNIRMLTDTLRFPEGPVALPDGSVLVVEIAAGCLTRVTTAGTVERIAETGGGPNGAAIGPDGFCYVCNNGGFSWRKDAYGLRPIGPAEDYQGGRIERVDLATGKVEVLYDRTENGRLSSPNDLVFDRHGGFWFTDTGKLRAREMDRGRVCYAKADGSFIKEVIFPIATPNGIGLSADETQLYVAETGGARIWRFDIAAPGEIIRQRFPSPNGGHFVVGVGGHQAFDSLAIDSGGNICAATLFHGGITVISPDGANVRHIAMPDIYTTNICFGGPNLQTAYVTLSQSGRLAALPWDRPGLELNFSVRR